LQEKLAKLDQVIFPDVKNVTVTLI